MIPPWAAPSQHHVSPHTLLLWCTDQANNNLAEFKPLKTPATLQGADFDIMLISSFQCLNKQRSPHCTTNMHKFYKVSPKSLEKKQQNAQLVWLSG